MDQVQQITLILTILNTIFQAISLLFLIIYVVKTWEMATATRKSALATEASVMEMRIARIQETAPYVIAYIDVTKDQYQLLYLVVKNIGKTTAQNVKLNIDPPLKASNQERFSRLSILNEGISSMPPDYEVRTFIESAYEYFSKDNYPPRYKVEIAFKSDAANSVQTTEQLLDMLALKGLMSIRRYDIHDLVERTEKLVNQNEKGRVALENIANTLDTGIALQSPYLFDVVLKQAPNDLIVAKLGEFKNYWHVTNEDRKSGLNLDRIQTNLAQFAQNLLVLRSLVVRKDEMTQSIASKDELLLKVIAILYGMSNVTFYIDGGRSLDEFNQKGDELLSDIELYIK